MTSASTSSEPTPPQRSKRKRRQSARAILLKRLILFVLPLWCVLAAEALTRLADGNALPEGRIFTTLEDGSLGLWPRKRADLKLGDGSRFSLEIDAAGLRAGSALLGAGTPTDAALPDAPPVSSITVTDGTPVPPKTGAVASSASDDTSAPLLIVGDELAFGWGVDDNAAFASRLTQAGIPALNAAVPGYGVPDALARADVWLGRARMRAVVLVFHEQDDWEQLHQTVEERVQVVDGWLRPRSGPGAADPVPSSLAARVHLLYHLSTLGARPALQGEIPDFAPGWLVRPESLVAEVQAVAEQLEQFAQRHPETPVIVLYIPSDLSLLESRVKRSTLAGQLEQAGARPWESEGLRALLKQALGVDITFVDAADVLRKEEMFLSAPYLSAAGHNALAELLKRTLQEVPEPQQNGEVDADTPATAADSSPTPAKQDGKSGGASGTE